MTGTKNRQSRRSFLKATAPAIAGGLAAFSVVPELLAEDAASARARAPKKTGDKPGDASAKKFWTKDYWAQRGDLKLYMFRKRASAPQPGMNPSAIGKTGSRLMVTNRAPARTAFAAEVIFS